MVLDDRVTDGAERERSGVFRERRTIGYVAPNVHGYFFGSILSGVRRTAAARNARVVAIQTHDAGISAFKDERFTAPVAWDQLDAVVVAQASVGESYLRDFAAGGKPVVTVYEEPADFECPTVVPDNRQAIEAAVAHFIEHGHSRIAFIGRDPANADDWLRYEAYRAAVTAHGLEPRDAVLVPWLLNEFYDGAAVIEALRADGDQPTAIVACTDATAMALISAFNEVGIRVPDDVAVIGFDDLAEAAVFQPPLTTVSQSFSLAGATAADLACDALDGIAVAPGLHFTPITFVVRQSCGCQEATADDVSTPEGTEAVRRRFAEQLGTVLGPRGLGRTTSANWPRSGPSSPACSGPRRSRPRPTPVPLRTRFSPRCARSPAEPPACSWRWSLSGRWPGVWPRSLSGRPLAAARVERVAFDVVARLFEQHRCASGKAIVNQHVELTRHYHTISAELVRQDRNPRSLSWLAGTEVRSGMVALWQAGRGLTDNRMVRIVGSFPTAAGTAVDLGADLDPASGGEVCPVQSFPRGRSSTRRTSTRVT